MTCSITPNFMHFDGIVSSLCPLKIDMAFKITIRSKFNSNLSQIQ
jgi:hypothetical protein